MDTCTNKEDSSKRKKKRSFMQQFKKRFKKSETFSKGAKVDSVEYDYFVRVFELESNFEGSFEEKEVFANNALAQTEGKEVDYSSNQLISRVIENLLPLASDSVLERFFEAFGTNPRPICVHEFASHVFQTLMIVAAKHSQAIAGEDNKHSTKCILWLIKVSRFLLNNIEEFMWDKFANPSLRTAMFCLAGVPHLDKHHKTGKDSNQDLEKTPSDVPEEFLDLSKEFYNRISTWPQFRSTDFVDNHLSSGYLQALLRAMKPAHKKVYKQLFTKILDDCFPTSDSELSPSALAVLDVMIEQSKDKSLRKIYNRVLQPRLLQMSSKVGHLTVQKFLNSSSDTEVLTDVMSTLVPHFSSVNQNVLVSLSQACQRMKTAQSDFYQALMKMLNCDESERGQKQVAVAVLSLQPLPHEHLPALTRPGSLILQALLHFQKPINLVNSLLAYEASELAELLSSIFGSFITGAFLRAEQISDKNKQKLIRRLVGYYAELAQTKFGSRTFDDLWEAADEKSRLGIVKDLAPSYSQLMASPTGQFVASKVFLMDFKKLGVEQWAKRVRSKESAKKLFAPIIGDVK